MLQHLSKTMASLYALAQEAEPGRFRAELLGLVRALIRFDGAVLETKHINFTARHDFSAQSDRVAERIATILNQAELPHCHAVTAAFFSALAAPQIINHKIYFQQHGLPWLREFATEGGTHKVLLYGDVPMPYRIPRWLILYRLGENDFTETDAALLNACWPHIVQAIEINLLCTLSRVDPHHAQRALSLVNSRGVIEIADIRLVDLLKTEWPTFDGCSLPQAALSALLDTGVFRGKSIELSAFRKLGYMACTGRRIPMVSMLSPSEMTVVQCFARGMTHSAIAGRIGVSPHTIRNQLANAYKKLGVHSKAELIRLISSI